MLTLYSDLWTRSHKMVPDPPKASDPGLNNHNYQIERATAYAAKEGLSDKLKFVKGDFMVRKQT